MINFTGADIRLIDSNGEVVGVVKDGECISIFRSNFLNNYTRIKPVRLSKMFKNEKHLLFPLMVMMGRVDRETNILRYKQEKYTTKRFAKDLDVSEQMARKYLSRFKELGIIKKIVFEGESVLAVNPYLINKSKRVDKVIVEEFRPNGWQ